ncbi:unnamed protein product [Rhizoctonia solani]|uniref:T6SS Phospholipase effector Tle1-like catalytic domain-containing protein n=1 Tax=Rhizoctonia solani TaxID=456999 RepID=A0A8H2XCB2_9AGAM|nr:unnamed protein product [Rhizoctonia solani]
MPESSSYQKLSLVRSPLQSGRYSLTLLRDEGQVYAEAHPTTSDYYFEDDEDRVVNLSEYVGMFGHELEWGFSDFQVRGEKIGKIEIWQHPSSRERFLRIVPKGREEAFARHAGPHSLNLDQYLDIIEEPDPFSPKLKAKFTTKRVTTQRRLVLCFDGTSNHFSNENTNVVKMVELLKKDDPERQMVLIPTCNITLATQPTSSSSQNCLVQVIDGYRYLMQTYRAGDQIYIFGFSRGAYTARALAGMLHSVGLLPKHNLEQASFAYEVYANSKEMDGKEPDIVEEFNRVTVKFGCSTTLDSSPVDTDPRAFMRAFCTPVVITLLGVWDTVGSVGTLTRKTLPWIEYNPSVKHFRQALALDENRGNFIPSLWNHDRTDRKTQTAVEVWFKGGHADIGGGAKPPGTIWDISCLQAPDSRSVQAEKNFKFPQPPRLSHITLRWMVRQCLQIPDAQLLFDTTVMRIYRDSRILEGWNTEGVLDFAQLDNDDITPSPFLASDQTGLNGWGWWLLDKFPVPKLSQEKTVNQPAFYLPFWWLLAKLPVPKLSQEKTADGTPIIQLYVWFNSPARLLPAINNDDVTPRPFWWTLAKLPSPKLAQGKTVHGPPTVYIPNNGSSRVIQFYEKPGVFLHSSVHAHVQAIESRAQKDNEDKEEAKYKPSAVLKNWPNDVWPPIAEPRNLGLKMRDSRETNDTEVVQQLSIVWKRESKTNWFLGLWGFWGKNAVHRKPSSLDGTQQSSGLPA